MVAIPEMANEAGGELVVSASSGGCDDYDVPDLSDVDCEAYESGTHYDYQQGPQYPILLEDALHPAAHGGMACGVVAFHQDYDGQLPQIARDSPFGTRSENNWGADDVTTQIPSSVGDDHPWGGAIDVALDHQYEGGQFYWSQQGQEYGREIAQSSTWTTPKSSMFTWSYFGRSSGWPATVPSPGTSGTTIGGQRPAGRPLTASAKTTTARSRAAGRTTPPTVTTRTSALTPAEIPPTLIKYEACNADSITVDRRPGADCLLTG